MVAKLYKMNIIEDYKCKYCQEMESAMDAFLICARAQPLWRGITTSLKNLGYYNFRRNKK